MVLNGNGYYGLRTPHFCCISGVISPLSLALHFVCGQPPSENKMRGNREVALEPKQDFVTFLLPSILFTSGGKGGSADEMECRLAAPPHLCALQRTRHERNVILRNVNLANKWSTEEPT